MTLDSYKKEIYEKEAIVQALKKRLEQMGLQLIIRKRELEVAEENLAKETKDVETLKKISISTMISKLSGSFEGKEEKEKRELYEAKLLYDDLFYTVEMLKDQMTLAEEEYETSKKELKELQQKGRLQFPEIEDTYQKLAQEIIHLNLKLKELEEAILAGNRVVSSAASAAKSLSSAKGWSTYDTFFGGGWFADLAKYDHLDDAQSQIQQVNYYLLEFKEELKDVDMLVKVKTNEYSSTQRSFDIFFDNIFTDLNTRNKIVQDQNSLYDMIDEVEKAVEALKQEKYEVENKLSELIIT